MGAPWQAVSAGLGQGRALLYPAAPAEEGPRVPGNALTVGRQKTEKDCREFFSGTAASASLQAWESSVVEKVKKIWFDGELID